MAAPETTHRVRDGVIVAVIVGLLSFVASIFSDVAREFLRDTIFATVTWSWWLFNYQIVLPLWFWLPLMIVAAIAIDELLPTKEEPVEGPRELMPADYLHEEFDGIHWRWEWGIYNGRAAVRDIVDYCPICSMQLVHGIDRFSINTRFRCEGCNYTAQMQGNWRAVQGTIERKIHHRINTGEWKAVVEQQQRDGQH